MKELIPNRFLFHFQFPLNYRAEPPGTGCAWDDWTDADLLPNLGEVDGRDDFAEVWACWNEKGLYIACNVEDKRKALRCDPKKFWKGDNLRLCVDLRDARSNRRATRFCQQFFFLPTGGGPKGDRPVAGTTKIQRAREDAPSIRIGEINIESEITGAGYTMAANIPAGCLSGFDPAEHPRIGFYYILEDRDHGQQYLTVGDDLYWYVDPSTWATASLEGRADR